MFKSKLSKVLLLMFFFTITLNDCVKKNSTGPEDSVEAAGEFEFKTVEDVSLNLVINESNDIPLSGVVFTLAEDASFEKVVFKGTTNDSGQIESRFSLRLAAPSLYYRLYKIGFQELTSSVETDDQLEILETMKYLYE